MRILVITERVPSLLGGGAARQFNLIRELAHEHEFTVATWAYPPDLPYIEALKPFVARIEFVQLALPTLPRKPRLYWILNAWCHAFLDPLPIRCRLPKSAAVKQIINEVLCPHSFDIVQVHQAYLAPLLPRVDVPTVLDLHDILSDHEYRVMTIKRKVTHRFQAWLEWKKMQAFERRTVRSFTVCVTVSESDRSSLLKLVPDARVVVVPNGVDTEYFSPWLVEQEPSLVFVGSMRYAPNYDGVRWFCDAIFPIIRRQRPDVRLYVVGWDPPPEILALTDDPNVTVTGLVDDVRPYLAKSAVVIVPVRFGSGTRLKILDAWAMGKAIVSTSLGAAGLEAVHGENILLADEPGEFATYVLELLANELLRARLGQAGRSLVEKTYSWRAIGKLMHAVYESCGALPRA